MSRYGKLAMNSGIFAVANLGSHLINFFLVRFYTELLTSAEYGVTDFIVTTSSTLIPVLTLAIAEAVLRFGIDHEEKTAILTNGLLVVIVGSIIGTVIAPLLLSSTSYAQYSVYLVLLICVSSLNLITSQFTRGIGKVAIFAVAGVIRTAALVCGNLLFLLCFDWGIKGYLLATILSEVISIVFLTCCAKLYRYIRFKWRGGLLREMLAYSVPLMPNSLCWWIMKAADKYVILAVLGTAANGLYAVAHKIPTLISLCNTIFFQAWQLSAVQEASSETKVEFYSNVFRFLSAMLCVVASMLILMLKPLTRILVASGYRDIWRYTPFLIVAMVFSAFSSFLGTNYVAMKKTKGALITSVFGAVINIVLNLCLVSRFGINGTAFATMVSFFVMWLYRAYDTRRFVAIQYDICRLGISIAILLTQAVVTICDKSVWISGGCVLVMVAVYIHQIVPIIQRLWHAIRKKARQ